MLRAELKNKLFHLFHRYVYMLANTLLKMAAANRGVKRRDEGGNKSVPHETSAGPDPMGIGWLQKTQCAGRLEKEDPATAAHMCR